MPFQSFKRSFTLSRTYTHLFPFPRNLLVIRMSSTNLTSLPPSSPSTKATDSVDPTPTSSSAPTKVKLTSHNQYSTPRLLRDQLHPDPLIQFNAWFTLALNGDESTHTPKVHEPEAMALSTVTLTSTSTSTQSKVSIPIPSTRIVLLKATDSQGFLFYTNYTSRKSQELLENPYASLCFYWRETSRQVRVVGRVEKVDRSDSEAYFNSRPVGSRLGAWASPQSTVVQDGEVQQRVEDVKKRFIPDTNLQQGGGQVQGEIEIECPEFWGGWRVIPFEVEFWSGQPSRLHDRFRYTRSDEASEWIIDRLAP
ncbi:hypothetical protein BCR39DRAFT_537602 [Naematelia encephala]|uniref:pyridoxal 5'-phosphate synthase n=1 Tax=Naematelia encephala TaxID=71784 RepID=A0A1Y2AZI5_9TREE|nr:hypothetical protein BCR39DRAFT_537602 [Naematelia encephala]